MNQEIPEETSITILPAHYFHVWDHSSQVFSCPPVMNPYCIVPLRHIIPTHHPCTHHPHTIPAHHHHISPAHHPCIIPSCHHPVQSICLVQASPQVYHQN